MKGCYEVSRNKSSGRCYSIEVQQGGACYTVSSTDDGVPEEEPELPPTPPTFTVEDFDTIIAITAHGTDSLAIAGMYTPPPTSQDPNPQPRGVLAEVTYVRGMFGGVGTVRDISSFINLESLGATLGGNFGPTRDKRCSLDTWNPTSRLSVLAFSWEPYTGVSYYEACIWIDPVGYIKIGERENTYFNVPAFMTETTYGIAGTVDYVEKEKVGLRYLSGDPYNWEHSTPQDCTQSPISEDIVSTYSQDSKDGYDVSLATEIRGAAIVELDDEPYRPYHKEEYTGQCFVEGESYSDMFDGANDGTNYDFLAARKNVKMYLDSMWGSKTMMAIKPENISEFDTKVLKVSTPQDSNPIYAHWESTAYIGGFVDDDAEVIFDRGERIYGAYNLCADDKYVACFYDRWEGVRSGAVHCKSFDGEISFDVADCIDFTIVDGVLLTTDGTDTVTQTVINPPEPEI